MNRFYLTLLTLFGASELLSGDCPVRLDCGELFFLNQMNSSYELEMKVDFLYWKSASEGLDYAFTYLERGAYNLPQRDDLRVHHADLPWKPSVRLTAGFSQAEWDVSLSWTTFQSHDSRSVEQKVYNSFPYPSAPGVQRLYRIWVLGNGAVGFLPNDITNLTTNYKLSLNTLDWDIGKLMALSHHLFVRPRFGIRAANLLQKMDIKASNKGLLIPQPNSIDVSNMNLKNDFLGLGIRLGGDAKFHLNRCFALVGDFSLSLLGGLFKVHERERYTLIELPGVSFDNPNRFNLKTVKPTLQFGVGAQFAHDSQALCSRFEFNIAYEFHYWMDQNQLYRVFLATSPDVGPLKHPGDVSLHGLSLQAGVYF